MEKWLTSLSARKLDKGEALISAPLPTEFYQRNTIQVAQDLLGKVLWVNTRPEYPAGHPRAELTAGRIVETEAYRAGDPASHSSKGPTPRCSIMFGEPGVAYIYFIYGMYEMLNFVTEPKGEAGAVLIRALEPLYGIPLMTNRRKNKNPKDLTRGPGKLCQAMGVQLSQNGQGLQGPVFTVTEDGFKLGRISRSGRVGIRFAQEKLWRFFITDSTFVSRAPQNQASEVFQFEEHG